jgi:hypothetical protein
MQVVFDDRSAWISGTELGYATYLTSTVDPSSSTVRLTLHQDEGGCTAGTVGEYAWALSPSGLTLTLTATSDPCAARAAAMAGTWFRRLCTNVASGCLGDLDAGTYPAQYIAPRRDPAATWAPDWGSISYTVPAGWSNSEDWPNEFSLTPSANYATEAADGPVATAIHDVRVIVQPRANAVTADCSSSVETKVPATVDGLLAWIGHEPALMSTTPVPITIGGHPGKWVDLRLASSWKATCPGGPGQPERDMLTYAVATSVDQWMAGVLGQERIRLILLDLDGHTVGIIIDTSNPATFNDLVSQAMPIISSLQFK